MAERSHLVLHWIVAGGVWPQAMDSSIPLAIRPHAVVRAVSMACAVAGAEAVAQLRRPRKSMHLDR